LADELRLGLAFLLALAGSAMAVRPAIRLALRLRFLDKPVGYKKHAKPTPYLGGLAVMAGFVPAAVAFGGGLSDDLWAILACAALLWAVGTVDDGVNLGPFLRLAFEVLAAVILWVEGLGWEVLGNDTMNLLLTIFWTVGLVNAFNLMDNLDGASGTVAMVSAAGTAAAAALEQDLMLAALALALSGACAGFLFFNLATPARIFLGDGGSMPLGLVVAAAIMAIPTNFEPGGPGFLAAIPLVGLPIFDTTFVVVSRARRGTNLFTGGRDHVTHRLLGWLSSPARVALTLGLTQAALCLVTLALFQAGETAAELVIGACLLLGATLIVFLEWPEAPSVPETVVQPESGA
jgi:UDP-GlcNAc:undecaprenyl-phosphate/decaprenyl-phosphate GlcNAc-1-phosphate transferase